MPDEPTPDARTRRVTITAPGWCVDVHADGVDLAHVADTARTLFEDLRDPTQERLGPAGAGFQMELNPQWDHDRQSGHMRRPVRGGAE